MAVYLIATLDTKGREAAFVRDLLVARGVEVKLVDAGCLGEPAVAADVTREQVFDAAGGNLQEVQRIGYRGMAVNVAAVGVAEILRQQHERGGVTGVLALGGSAGTTIGTAAMRALPLGIPKLMVSTLASGQVRHYVRDKDILLLNSVVDIAGINRISRLVLTNAAHAMAGMCQRSLLAPREENDAAASQAVDYRSATPGLGVHRNLTSPNGPTADKPLIAATMFGVTTPCIEHARKVLEDAGYEVLVFHATGNGGQAMESLIAEGLIAGVLDITTTELADELVGGVLSAGPDRLTAAAEAGVPQVVSVGALDMVNFHAFQTVPEEFRQRRLHRHNANVTLMRTTAEENAKLGQEICHKLSTARGPAAILLPLLGVSAIDRAGQPFDDPTARAALFNAIRQHHGTIELNELDHHINDRQFAEAAAHKLLQLIQKRTPAVSART